jgi:hypothetical protein
MIVLQQHYCENLPQHFLPSSIVFPEHNTTCTTYCSFNSTIDPSCVDKLKAVCKMFASGLAAGKCIESQWLGTTAAGKASIGYPTLTHAVYCTKKRLMMVSASSSSRISPYRRATVMTSSEHDNEGLKRARKGNRRQRNTQKGIQPQHRQGRENCTYVMTACHC